MLSAAPLADGRAEPLPPPVVAVRNLRRDYGAIKAVKDISFEIQEGEIK